MRKNIFKPNYFLRTYKQKKRNYYLINILLMVLIMIICTVVSLGFNYLNMSETNIVMIYLLGILLYSFVAEGYYQYTTHSIMDYDFWHASWPS